MSGRPGGSSTGSSVWKSTVVGVGADFSHGRAIISPAVASATTATPTPNGTHRRLPVGCGSSASGGSGSRVPPRGLSSVAPGARPGGRWIGVA